MRKIPFFFILISCFAISQNKQLLYGFSEIPQSLLLNPGGKVTNDWYFGIPLLSHIHVNGGTSGTTVYDLFANDGINFNTKLKNAVYSMKPSDFLTFNEQIEVFSGGFKIGNAFEKNQYVSFGLYQEMDVIAYFPKDYAILAYEGNQSNINRVFDAGDFKASAEVISVFHVGYNKKVNDDFTFGVRGKIYSSIMNISSTKNNGYFVTVNGTNNFYDHIFNLDLEVQTSGIASLTADNTDSKTVVKDLKKRLFLGGDLGLGFDIGFTYQLNKQWMVDGSLQDIGFISHSKDVENYSVKGNYVFEGVNPIFPESGAGQTAENYWNDIKDNFNDLFIADTTYNKYTTWRPIKLNASINYAFGEKRSKVCDCLFDKSGYQNAVGLQLFAINRPLQPQLALTAYYYRRLFKGLQAKATYTIDSYTFHNIGFGISANLGPINFYLMADNFLEYQNIYNAQSVSLQLGFNYIFTKHED
ncbi:hypothetical protein GCM10007962_20760 [Yeosuana aromativorans]|uniref:DUF5723 domain-containing protein n=1 Tax=Yeosuana aromativorans TaxID=288019 RepID=A0A8J3BPF9_9FLAO|nr:DUF5723 family protein [Yeosuana aromativorans]GGK26314.1 hypothetical protein GCM10007962_20760 [Yeosuana aromativorans]